MRTPSAFLFLLAVIGGLYGSGVYWDMDVLCASGMLVGFVYAFYLSVGGHEHTRRRPYRPRQ